MEMVEARGWEMLADSRWFKCLTISWVWGFARLFGRLRAVFLERVRRMTLCLLKDDVHQIMLDLD